MVQKIDKGLIRNGQPHYHQHHHHFPIERREQPSLAGSGDDGNVIVLGKNDRLKKVKRQRRTNALSRLFVFCAILLLAVCCGFVAISYHLYKRQNAEVQIFTEKINSLYGDIDRLFKKLDNLSRQNDELEELRKKIDNLSSAYEERINFDKMTNDTYKRNSNCMQDVQNGFHTDPLRVASPNINMLQGSVSSRFKSVAIENIEEYPDNYDLEEDNDIENDEYQDDEAASDDLTDDTKTGKSVEIYNNYRPANISLNRPHRNGTSYRDNNTDDSIDEANPYDAGNHSKISKRNAPLPLHTFTSNSKSQPFNNKTSRYANVGGLDQNSSDTLDLLNENKATKLQDKTIDKRCMISIPLEDFIDHFKHYQHEYNGKMQELLNKTNANCSTVSVNTIKQNSNRRSKYNFRLRSSEEEDADHSDVESIMSHRRRFREDKSDKLKTSPWKKQLDVEILSENADDDESLQMRPRDVSPVAIHSGGSATNHKVGHDCYYGNGRKCYPTGEAKNFVASNWVHEYQMLQHFTLTDGELKVHKSGLYFVYSQIWFSDSNDYNGYYIMHNKQVALQCTLNIPTMGKILHNSCYTGGIIKCNENDILSIKIDGSNRYIMLVENMSYFGMFKIKEMN